MELLVTQARDQWKSRADVDSSRVRYRVCFNNKSPDADPRYARLRTAGTEVNVWRQKALNSRAEK